MSADFLNESNQNDQMGYPGVLEQGIFWYFKDEVNTKTIINRQSKKLGQKIITVVAAIVFALSLFSFLLGLVLDIGSAIFEAETWLLPNGFLLMLSVAVLTGLFIFFRVFDARTRQKKLPDNSSKVDLKVTTVPSLEAVSKRANIAEVLNNEAYEAIEEAYRIALGGGHAQITAVHLFVGCMSTKQVQMMMMRLGISFAQTKDALRRHMQAMARGETHLGLEAHTVIAQAFKNAVDSGRSLISPIELFAESYAKDEFLKELLYSVKVEEEEFDNTVEWIRIDDKLNHRYQEFRKAAGFKATGTMNKAYTSVATPFLDRVSDDLTLAAVRGRTSMLIGRHHEMEEILRAMESGLQSVVLVGPPGVGKNAIIAGIAERMAQEDVPKMMQDKRLVQLSIPHIVSAEGGAGAQERLLIALQEVGMSGNIILVIENLDLLMGGFASGVDLSAVLASELEKRYTLVIATATPQGYTAKIEGSILAQKFSKVLVEEPERNQAIHVLQSKISGVENQNKVIFTYSSLAKVVDLSRRYMHDSFLPEKAILLAQEVGNMVGKRGEDWQTVTEEDIAEIITQKTKVLVTEVSKGESAKLLNLEEKMHERMIGQDEAVNAIAAALRRARVQLRAEGKPIANFLFLGPTGVGKTELAKTTAETYFGSEDAMLRFDMSEYQDQASITKLIGATGQGGLLTEAVRKNPFSLLLLDELEKANPNILNLFLQVMDDGRLTDGTGRTVDFTNVILIATSNAGTQYIQDEVAKGTDLEVIKQHLMEVELKQVYRPEFLNRFDGIMVFKPLSPDDVVAIAYLMIAKVAKRLEAKGITFKASDEAIHQLAEKGYDPKFGARPLRRVIQDQVENAVADHLLKGDVGRRDTLVLQAGGKIEIEKAAEL